MTRALLYMLIALLLVLTVPWFFSERTAASILGMPIWAAYSLCMSLLFALCMAVLLPRSWHLSAGDDDD